jgi:hypothetical protein
MHSGLCTLIGVREKPGGREKANRGKKEREGEEGEEEKEKRKRKEEKKKMHQASTAARLCQYKNSPPQAMPAAGVAILKGHFTIHQITKTQLPCGFSWLLGRRELRASPQSQSPKRCKNPPPLRRPRYLSYSLHVLYMACGLWRETTRITSTLIGGHRGGADEWRRPARRHLVHGRR